MLSKSVEIASPIDPTIVFKIIAIEKTTKTFVSVASILFLYSFLIKAK